MARMGRPSSQNSVNRWLTLVSTERLLQKRPQRKLTRGGRPGVCLVVSAVSGSTCIRLRTLSVYSRTSCGGPDWSPSGASVNVSKNRSRSSVSAPPLTKLASGTAAPVEAPSDQLLRLVNVYSVGLNKQSTTLSGGDLSSFQMEALMGL